MSSWGKVTIFSVAMICLTIIASSFAPAISQQRQSGYMIASDGDSFVWRVNTFTGAVSYCARRDDSKDPALLARRAPYCSKPSPAIE